MPRKGAYSDTSVCFDDLFSRPFALNLPGTMRTSPLIPLALTLLAALPARAHKPAELVTGTPVPKHLFIPNQGQWEGAFAFKAEVGPLALFMEPGGLTWSLLQSDFADILHDASYLGTEPILERHVWKVRFENASTPEFRPGAMAAYRNNYFLGNDPARWRSEVPLYDHVTYAGVWQGTDLRMYLHEGRFKYDLLLAPGADLSRVGLRYEGVDDLRIDDLGRLVFRTSLGSIVEERPVAWYDDERGGAVDCRYTLRGGSLGYELVGADRSRPITIDPTLIAATLSGSTSTNYGHSATYDLLGNIYTGAISFGQGYPTNAGSFQQVWGGGGTDIAVSKINPTGTTLLFATYLGGNGGDYPHSLIVDNDFNLWVYGSSNSANYPVTSGAIQTSFGGGVDIVVSKVGPTGGVLVGSTFIGGSANDGRNGLVGGGYEQYRGEIVLDNEGNAYVASCTVSANFPVTTGAFQTSLAGGQDGVVFSLDPTVTLLRFSTFLGGGQGDMAYGLKVRNDGKVVVSGGTASTNFPVTAGVVQGTNAGSNDVFVSILDPLGATLERSTYWGTSGGNVAYFIELDGVQNVYVYGVAAGGVPIQPAGTYGIPGGGNFVACFDPELTELLFSSSIGPNSVAPVAFLVDYCDNIYISGYQAGAGLPLTSDALYTSGGFYIAVFQPGMQGLLYGTYYTGATHVDGGTSRFDPNGVIYQGVCTSGGLPLTPGAWGTTQASWDIGVFKIDMEQAGIQSTISTSATFGCTPATATFTAIGNAPNFIWDPGDGSPQTTGPTLTHTYDLAGTYTIMLIGWDSTSCNIADTTFAQFNVFDPVQLEPTFTFEPISTCYQYGVQVNNTTQGGVGLAWQFGDGGTGSSPSITHTYPGPGSYDITLAVTGQLCETDGSTTLTVVVPPASITVDLPSPVYLCPGSFVQLNAGLGWDTYQWSTGQQQAIIDVTVPGTYGITVTQGFCTADDVVEVVEVPVPEPMEDQTTCPGLNVTLSPTFETASIQWNTGATEDVLITDVGGLYWFIATDAFGCLVRDTVEVYLLPSTEGEGFIPNVFSPNNDGLNDVFEVGGLGLQEFRMEVFNRWGQLMYESNTPQRGWNGGLGNSSDKVPDGTYYYVISYRDLCSQEPFTKRTGHVTLLR